MEGKELKNVDMTAKFSNFQVINKDFTRCRCNVFYTGRNRNYSDITEEALQKFIQRKGYANVPVVAHLMKDDDGNYHVGGHDFKLVISNEGMELVNECVAFGVIPEDCNPSMDLITERSGEQKQYFSVDIILWTHRYPIMNASFNDDVYFNQSMEISFEDYSIDGDYVVVNDFTMSALCLLNRSMNPNDNIEPCFESSRVKKFSLNEDKFKENFELMLEKLKQYELEGDSTSIQNKKFSSSEPNNHKQNEEEKASMELAKFTEALSTQKIEGTENAQYALLSVDKDKVFALDMTDYKPYGFDYAITTENGAENLVIDFNSKVEMSLSATEKITEEGFNEFSIHDVIDTNVKAGIDTEVHNQTEILQGEFNKKVDELKQSYEDLSAAHKIALEKLERFEVAEAKAEAEKHEKDVNALFEKFATKLSKCAEFLVYKAKVNPADVTLEEVEENLTLMAGRYAMDSASKASFSYQPQEAKVTNKENNEVQNRYGNLLSKYMK